MFRRLSEPLPLSAASLLLFRQALNAPVLNVGWLPVGPARAAVVVFAEEYGGIGIALGLRATESGQVAVVRNQESIDFDVPIGDALEPLLAEAERMGFLFDEDLLDTLPGERGRSQAMNAWARLMGGLESLLPPQLGELPPSDAGRAEEEASGPLSPSLAVAEAQYPELILDDVAPLELDDEAPGGGGVETAETLEPEVEREAGLGSAPGPLSDCEPDPDVRLELESDPEESLELESDPEASLGLESSSDESLELEPGPDDSLELEHGLDEALEDALGDPLGDDWATDDPHFDDSDRTEPTAPTPAARDVSAPVANAARAAETAVLPRATLSKFRHVERSPVRRSGGGRSEVGTDRSSELARIPIVRVRREREPGKRVPVLARLLSSF